VSTRSGSEAESAGNARAPISCLWEICLTEIKVLPEQVLLLLDACPALAVQLTAVPARPDAGTASATHVPVAGSAAALQAAFSPASGLTASALATPVPPAPGQPKAESLSVAGSASAAPSVGDKRKSNYFEFAKKKWESEDAFRLPDGTCAPRWQGPSCSPG